MTPEEIAEILAKHKLWLADEGGERANLSKADMRGADLIGADLSRTNLTDTSTNGW